MYSRFKFLYQLKIELRSLATGLKALLMRAKEGDTKEEYYGPTVKKEQRERTSSHQVERLPSLIRYETPHTAATSWKILMSCSTGRHRSGCSGRLFDQVKGSRKQTSVITLGRYVIIFISSHYAISPHPLCYVLCVAATVSR